MTADLLTRPAHRLWTPEDLDILDAVTRREFIAMMGAVDLLAACGDDDGGDSVESEDPATRTVEHFFGSTEVPVAHSGSSPPPPLLWATFWSIGVDVVAVNLVLDEIELRLTT